MNIIFNQPYNLSIIENMKKELASGQQLSPFPREAAAKDEKNGRFEEKRLLGVNVPKIDRIYSNNSNIETAEESPNDSNDPFRQSAPQFTHPTQFLKFSSTFQNIDPQHPFLQFRKYQSDLQNSCLQYSGSSFGNNHPNEEAVPEAQESGQSDSIILQEQRESNQSLSFEAQTMSLKMNSILKPLKPRVQHSFLINTNSTLLMQQSRNRTLNQDTKLNFTKQKNRNKQNEIPERSIGSTVEAKGRKNVCLKKKTLTNKESIDTSLQEEEYWQAAKSFKKVNFKGNQNEQPKQQPNKIKNTTSNRTHLTPKSSGKRVESITSICLSGKTSEDGRDLTAPLKSSRTLHDLGNNNLIYRIRGSDKTTRACQAIEVERIEQERRETEVFEFMRRQCHPNLLRLHTITIQPRTDRTILMQTVDFYPRNLHQYLAELVENDISADQRAKQRKLILFQILKGLHFMHSQQITHRNLCPSSILLNDSLHTVIAGFSSIDCPKLSMRVGIKCEWLIRPPEIIMQPKFSFSPAGDIWQFGCLIVFMLRHKMPFQEFSDSGMIVEMSRCIGKPSSEDRAAIGLTDHHKFIFPNFRRQSIGKSFKCNEPDLVEVLRRIFVFNPFKRATTSQLLQSRYFDDLRKTEVSQSGLEEETTSVLCHP